MKLLAENRRARFDYEILGTYEAGISLTGQEVKSIKSGRMNLSGSYAIVREGAVFMVNSDVPPYQPKNVPVEYDSVRTRKLLLKKEEIKSLSGRLQEKGLALFPLKAYLKKNLIKIELGLGRSRKKSDRREFIKKRETEKEIKKNLG